MRFSVQFQFFSFVLLDRMPDIVYIIAYKKEKEGWVRCDSIPVFKCKIFFFFCFLYQLESL
jgi:hypothetical protein